MLRTHLLAQRLGACGVDVGCSEDLQGFLTQRAAPFVLRLQVGSGGLHDLLDLRALRVGGVQAVKHGVDAAHHVLGRATEMHHPGAAFVATLSHAHAHAHAHALGLGRERRACRDPDNGHEREGASHSRQRCRHAAGRVNGMHLEPLVEGRLPCNTMLAGGGERGLAGA